MGLAPVHLRQRHRTIGRTGRQSRQLGRVGHHAVAGIQLHRNQPVREGQDFRPAVVPQEAGSHQRCHIKTPHRRGGSCAVTGDRRLHGTRDVRQNPDLARDGRHVLRGRFHGVLQRLLHFPRNFRRDADEGRQQLVGKHPGLAHLVRITQPFRDQPREIRVSEDAVTGKGVQVHPRSLPRGRARNLRPVSRPEVQRRQHLKRHVRHCRGIAGFLECLECLHQRRKQLRFHLAAAQPAIKGLTLGRFGLRVHHLDHVRERWLLADAGAEQLIVGAGRQPALHQPLRRSAKRLAARHTAADDLHEVP